jgi:thiol-disulfide isomerase/thioredoxin
MKKIWIFLLFTSSILKAQVTNYNVGDLVDDFTVTDIYGNQYSLHQLTSQGKYVYIDFFYTSCASCQNIIPVINEFWDKYGCGAHEVFCLAINRGYDNNADVLNFENQYGGSSRHCPAISSEGGALDVVNNFGVNVFPTVCLIAPDNKLINKDIHPVEYVRDLENTFPSNFNPQPSACSSSVSNNHILTTEIYITPDGNILIRSKKTTELHIKIYDMSGRLIVNKQVKSNKIDIKNLKNRKGSYLLQLSSNNSIFLNKILIL